MIFFLQTVSTGIMVGGIYALIALGFVLIFKSSKVVSIAQGELMLVGSYACLSLMLHFHLGLLVSIIITMLCAAILGMLIERFFLRPLIAQPLIASVMMTIAIASLLRGLVVGIWKGLQYPYPQTLASGNINVGSLVLSGPLLVSFACVTVLVVVFTLFFQRSKLGLGMRATAEDQQVVQSCGIRVSSIFSWAWIISAVLAAIAGFLFCSQTSVNLAVADLGLKAVAVAILGGMDSIGGAIVAGLIIGVLENLAVAYLDPFLPASWSGGGLRDVIPFIVKLLVMLRWPYGLFGLRKIERI